MMGITPLLAAVAAAVLTLPPIPLITDDPGEVPVPEAPAWILYDHSNQVVLAEQDADGRRPMASVTKVMTALVARDHTSAEEVAIISDSAAATGEAEIGVVAGERWTVHDLLAAMMVRSGNDAAVALAEHVGGDVDTFVDLMNAKAAELGMRSSRFANPHGLDAEDHYSTARDLLTMALAAMEDPVIDRLARTKVVKFRDDPNGAVRRAVNTNELLGAYPGVVGMKTGFTSGAGRVLIAVAEQHDRVLVSVVLGTEDHFEDTRQLLEWGFDTYGLGDRIRALLLEPQGGGAAPPPVVLTPDEDRRLRAMPPLPTLAPSTPRALTPLERQLEARLRERLPLTLGGAP